jgi:hypothetical protein
MKKILLSLGVFTSISLSAQTIVNGGFESPFIPLTTNTYVTAGWVVFNGSADLTSFSEGKQSVKLVTADNPTISKSVNYPGTPGTICSGVIEQEIKGSILNPENLKFAFDFKFTKINDDGNVTVLVYDSLQKGFSDDVLLYATSIDLNSTVSQWEKIVLPLKKQSGVGNANRVKIIAVSSRNGYYNTTVPTAGSTLWLDNFQLAPNANVDENTLSDLKVYPNPATDVLKFETSEEIESVIISSIEGKVVREVKESSNVNVSDLKAGVYVYRLTTRLGKQAVANFIKE